MKYIRTRGPLIILAALMLLPHAMAVESGFGTSSGSSNINMDLSTKSSFCLKEDLGQSGITGFTTAEISDDGDRVNQYHDAISKDGKATVATYAYMDTPGSWNYKWGSSSTRTSASIWETVGATSASNILFGGFASNGKDYAAVQVWSWDDATVDSINYRNDLYASSSTVKASQKFDATGANLGMEAWANRGNIDNEATTEDAIEEIWNDIAGPGSYPSESLYDLAVSQYASINAEKINSYSSSASIGSNKADGAQSAKVDGAENAVFYSGSGRGVPIGDEEANWIFADISADFSGVDKITYSSKSASSSKDITSSQTIDVQNCPLCL